MTTTKAERKMVPERLIKKHLSDGWKISYLVKRAYADGTTARDACMVR